MRQGVRGVAAVAAALAGAAAVLVVPALPVGAADPGDGQRFDTWTGYEVNRFPVEALAGDFDEDGAPDVAWVRNDFFENTLSVTLNLGEGTFDDPIQLPAVEDSKDGAVADLDGDGNLDIVVVGQGVSLTNTVVDLYFGDGEGGFRHDTATGGVGPGRVAAADLDGDEDVDLALANSWSSSTVSVLFNEGSGSFAPEVTYTVGEQPGGIVATDIDGDGNVDLVAAAMGFDGFAVGIYPLLGDGAGDFTVGAPVGVDDQMGDLALAAGDLDGDELPDLVVGGIGGDSHTILLNEGDLDFAHHTVAGGFSSADIELRDLEGDGDVDIVSATMGSSSTGDITVLRNEGDGTAYGVETLSSSHQPWGIDLADFDGDGAVDLAAANRGTSLGVIHQGGDGGTFESPAQAPLFAPPFKITTGDLDGDGDVDVAASIQGFSASTQVVQVLLNDGTGTMVPSATIPAGGRPFSIDAGDMDADGDDDLVWELFGFSQPDVGVSFSNGDGTFTDAELIRVNDCAPGSVTTSDMDGDGDSDLVIPDEDGGDFGTDCVQGESVTIVPSNGDGTFGDAVRVATESIPRMAVGADVDGDGLADVVSAHSSGNGGDLAVALNTGDLTFAPHVEIDTGRSHRELAAADLDGDGDTDVATIDTDDGMTVFENDGTGTEFEAAFYGGETVSGYLNAVAIDIGDVDVDGVLDVAAANWTGNDVGVWFGNGDGTFAQRALHYGMNTALSDLALADFDGDGLLDVAVPNTSGGVTSSSLASTLRVPESEVRGSSVTASGATASASAAAAANGVSVALNVGTPECTLRGSNGPDVLRGTRGRDVICTLGGDDAVDGRGGDDLIITGDGNDKVMGGTGNDVIDVGGGRDSVDAGDGDDVVTAVDGRDRLLGGAGTDRLDTGTGPDRLDGGPGPDTLAAGKGADTLLGGGGNDRCDGGADTDQARSCEVSRHIP